ncbi:hypothetical protein HOY82DRAFT_597412 [Tuber indicum]|nr:hypothetical protein HOY82DRAFT_597412 [Tuber indicum]
MLAMQMRDSISTSLSSCLPKFRDARQFSPELAQTTTGMLHQLQILISRPLKMQILSPKRAAGIRGQVYEQPFHSQESGIPQDVGTATESYVLPSKQALERLPGPRCDNIRNNREEISPRARISRAHLSMQIRSSGPGETVCQMIPNPVARSTLSRESDLSRIQGNTSV